MLVNVWAERDQHGIQCGIHFVQNVFVVLALWVNFWVVFASCSGQDFLFSKPPNKSLRTAASSAPGQATGYNWNPVAASSSGSAGQYTAFPVLVSLAKCLGRFVRALHFTDRRMAHLSVQVQTWRLVTEPLRFCAAEWDTQPTLCARSSPPEEAGSLHSQF